MDISKVGVVGCGLMGSGIAEVSAKGGFTVVVREVNDDVLEAGRGRIERSMGRAVEKEKLTAEDADATFARTVELLGLPVTEVCYCPHPAFPAGCFCRKPMPGIGVYLRRKYDLAADHLVMVGDMDSDRKFAETIGATYHDSDAFFASA